MRRGRRALRRARPPGRGSSLRALLEYEWVRQGSGRATTWSGEMPARDALANTCFHAGCAKGGVGNLDLRDRAVGSDGDARRDDPCEVRVIHLGALVALLDRADLRANRGARRSARSSNACLLYTSPSPRD